MLEAPRVVAAASTQLAPAEDASSTGASTSSSTSATAASITLTYCPPAHTSWTTFPYTSTAVYTHATTTLYTTSTRTIVHSAPAATVSDTATATITGSSPAHPSRSSLRSFHPLPSSDTRAPPQPHRRKPYGVAHLTLSHAGQRQRRTQASDSATEPSDSPYWIGQQRATWTEYSLVPTMASSAVVAQPPCYVTVVPAGPASSPSSGATSSDALPSPSASSGSSLPTTTPSPGIPGLSTRTRVSYATVSEMDYYTVTRTLTTWIHAPSLAPAAENRTSTAPAPSSTVPDGTLAHARQPSLMASNEVGKIIGGVVGGVGGSLVLLLVLLCLFYPIRRRKSTSSHHGGPVPEKGHGLFARRPSPPPASTLAAAGDVSNPLSANALVEPKAADQPSTSPTAGRRLVRLAGLLGLAPARQQRLDRLFNPSQVLHHATRTGSSIQVPQAWPNPSDPGTPDLFDRSPMDGAMQMTLSTSLQTMDSPEPYGLGAPGTARAWAVPFGGGVAYTHTPQAGVQVPITAAPVSGENDNVPAGGGSSMLPSQGTSINMAAAQCQSPSPDTTPSPQTPVNPIAVPLIGPGQWLSGKHVDPGTPEEPSASEGPAPVVQPTEADMTGDVTGSTESVSLREEVVQDTSDELDAEASMATALSFPRGLSVDDSLEGDLANRPPTGLDIPTTAPSFPLSSSLDFAANSSTSGTDAIHTRLARPSSPLMGEATMERMATVQPEMDRPTSLRSASVLHMPVPVRPVVLPPGTVPSSSDHQPCAPVGQSASEHETMTESDPTDFQTALSVSIPQLYPSPPEPMSSSAANLAPSETSVTSASAASTTAWANAPMAFPVPPAGATPLPLAPAGVAFPPSRYSQTLGKLESEEQEDQMVTTVAQSSFPNPSMEPPGYPTPRMPPQPLGETGETVDTEPVARSSVYSPRPPDWPIPTAGASLGGREGDPTQALASSESSEESAAPPGTVPAGATPWVYEPQSFGQGFQPVYNTLYAASTLQTGDPAFLPDEVNPPSIQGRVAERGRLSLERAAEQGLSNMPTGATVPSTSSVPSAPQETLSAETLSVAASQSNSPVGFLPVPVIIDPNLSSESSALHTSSADESHEQVAAPDGDGFFGRPRSGPLLVVNTDPQAQSSSSTLPPRSD